MNKYAQLLKALKIEEYLGQNGQGASDAEKRLILWNREEQSFIPDALAMLAMINRKKIDTGILTYRAVRIHGREVGPS